MASGDEFGSELYDLARGPRPPVKRRGHLRGVWDDPTWLSVEVDEELMREAARELEQREWVSVKEAARLLEVPASWVYRGLRSGVLPVRTLPSGGNWRLVRADVERVAADFRATPGSFDT
jgi:excisionase family DNA binding protein